MMLNAILTGIPLKTFSCDYYKRFMVENCICGSEYIILMTVAACAQYWSSTINIQASRKLVCSINTCTTQIIWCDDNPTKSALSKVISRENRMEFEMLTQQSIFLWNVFISVLRNMSLFLLLIHTERQIMKLDATDVDEIEKITN